MLDVSDQALPRFFDLLETEGGGGYLASDSLHGMGRAAETALQLLGARATATQCDPFRAQGI